MKVASLFFAASLVLSNSDALAVNKTHDGLRGSERNLQFVSSPVETGTFNPSKVSILVKYKTEQGKQGAIRKASKVDYESSRFKVVAMEIAETDMLALENDPEIEFVDLNLERSLFPPIKNYDFYSLGQDGDGEKPKKKPVKEKPVKDRRRLAETVPYGIVSVQAYQNINGVAPGPFANDIKVCVVDTGYDLGHEDLPDGDRVAGFNYYGERWDVDGNSHGTHCAGTIAAIGNNGKGVVGVIPSADTTNGTKLHIGKGLNDNGSGNTAGVLAAVGDCVAEGANVISMSLGGGGYSNTENSQYEEAYLEDDVLIIAAAGNGGNSGLSYPASYPSVMSVAAVDSNENRASFSQWNEQVEISGPGVGVQSTIPGGYDSYSGTSMATPHVAGVAALVWSYNTTCSAQQIRRILLASAMSLGQGDCNEFYGRGLVQAKAAVEMLQEFGCEAADPFSLLAQNGLNSDGSCHDYGALVPTAAPTPTPPPTPITCSSSQELVTIDLFTDRYCQETKWTLRNSAGGIEMASPAYIIDVDDETQFVYQTCVAKGSTYEFTIEDTYGDGICCSYGNGSYKVMCGDVMMADGGDFLDIETTSIPVPDAIDNSPSASPSSLPSLEPSSAPSGSPSSIPSSSPSAVPSTVPSLQPSMRPSTQPSSLPSASPSLSPSFEPSASLFPSSTPSQVPSAMPSNEPSGGPSPLPGEPTSTPSYQPSSNPSKEPSSVPSMLPSDAPSISKSPTRAPTEQQTDAWNTITYDDFNDYAFNEGWGNFADGGGDARRITDSMKDSVSRYIPEGSASLRIRDDSSSSNIYLKESYDVSGFTNLRVSFSFEARDLENSDGFHLQYSDSDGQNWELVKSWVIHSEFENDEYYYETVDFNALDTAYNLTPNAKIRFVCDSTRNNDQIFIDEVMFEGFGPPPS